MDKLKINFSLFHRHLHLELYDIAWKLWKIYKLQIRLIMTTHLVTLIRILSHVYSAYMKDNMDYESQTRFLIGCLMWSSVTILRLLYVNFTCERTIDEVILFNFI